MGLFFILTGGFAGFVAYAVICCAVQAHEEEGSDYWQGLFNFMLFFIILPLATFLLCYIF